MRCESEFTRRAPEPDPGLVSLLTIVRRTVVVVAVIVLSGAVVGYARSPTELHRGLLVLSLVLFGPLVVGCYLLSGSSRFRRWLRRRRFVRDYQK